MVFVHVVSYACHWLTLGRNVARHEYQIDRYTVVVTWTLLAADVKTLEAFHMKCQRQILRIRWQDHVRNDEVAARIQACAQ